jgi:heme-degrading monooxygenase HmoA
MMHARVSQITAEPPVLAGCLAYLEHEVRPVVESQHGSLGLSLLAGQEPFVAIVESFWATHEHELVWAAAETEARVRGELARRIRRPVTAEDYQIPVFEREAPLRSGEAVRLTRMQVKPPGAADVADVFGDTAVPWLADTPGFCGALLFAAPASGRLISQTVWRDPATRAASPSLAEMIRAEVLDDQDCEILAVEDYSLVFSSARKPSVPSS